MKFNKIDLFYALNIVSMEFPLFTFRYELTFFTVVDIILYDYIRFLTGSGM